MERDTNSPIQSSIKKYTNPTSHQQVIDPYFNHYAPFNSSYSKNVQRRYSHHRGWNPNFINFYEENTSKLPSNNLPAKLQKTLLKEASEAYFLRPQLHGYKEQRIKIQEVNKIAMITGEKNYKKFSTSFPLPEDSKDDCNKSMVTIIVPKSETAETAS